MLDSPSLQGKNPVDHLDFNVLISKMKGLALMHACLAIFELQISLTLYLYVFISIKGL